MKFEDAIKYARQRAASYDKMLEYMNSRDEVEYITRNAEMLRTLCNEVERLRRITGRAEK